MVASLGSAVALHVAASRADAVYVVPIAIAWGCLVVASADRMGRVALPTLLLVALLVRMPQVGTPPLLSDDLFRYLFEGLASNAGHNPFVTPPAELPGLHESLRAQVNHPEVPTIYPPLALVWFRLLALGGTVGTVQLATALVDVSTVAAIALGTRRAWPAWIYALHPLPVLEAAAGGHVDVVAVSLAAWGVVAWRRGWLGAGWWALAMGAAVKLFPAVLLPALWRRLPRPGLHLLGTSVAMLVLAAPVLDAGPALLEGFGAYAQRWSFNGLVFSWVEQTEAERALARPLLVAIGAAIGLLALVRERDPGRLWAVVGGAFVLLSPTVHPWYVLWALVPALLCERWGWAAAGVALLASYTVLAAFDPATGRWSEAPWLWWATWGPAVPALLVARYRSDWSATAP